MKEDVPEPTPEPETIEIRGRSYGLTELAGVEAGRARAIYALESDQGENYLCSCTPRGPRCTCPASVHLPGLCKHLKALIELGKVRPAAAEDE